MLRIAVCDDEIIYLDKIKRLIQENLLNRVDTYEIETFMSGSDLCKEDLRQYQVFFLDINMSDMNGLETAKKIREVNEKALLVFITAYIDYAMEGYKFDALRYIIKDMMEDMIRECIETVLQRLKINDHKNVYNFLSGKQEIYTEQILYIESNRHRLTFYIYCRNGLVNYCLYDKLDNIQIQLESVDFLRIHKSYLVNMKYISDMIKYKVILKDGTELPIPRDRYAQIEKQYYENEGKMI